MKSAAPRNWLGTALLSLALAAILLLPRTALSQSDPVHLSHGRFKELSIYRPAVEPNAVVLLLSGDSGWDVAADRVASAIKARGALVVGIDLKQLTANLEADESGCVFPDGDLENLSHFVQAFYHSPTYLTPMLVGLGSGAGLAYAMLVQAPQDTFSSAVTQGFCPQFPMAKPLCKGSGLEFTHRSADRGVEWKAAKSIGNSWVSLSQPGQACPESVSAAFLAQVRGAAAVKVPAGVGDAPLLAAFSALSRKNPALHALPPSAVGDLPVIEVPAQAPANRTDAFAIVLSGDGGWAGLDKEVAGALSAAGMPVVGLDSLRYFWTARTPEGLARDVDRLIRYYLVHFGKKRVLLIGYSQGADVLPFAVNRLPASTRSAVALTAILGMSEHALFEFHVTSWISDDNSGPVTLPEVERITSIPLLCIYGAEESDSLCPKLDAQKFKVVKLKGGHHFDGDYTGLAQVIIGAAKP